MAFRQDSRRSLLTEEAGFGRQPYQSTPSYDGGSGNDNTAAGGYHYREGIMTPSKGSGSRKSLDFVATKWPRLFFLTIGIQALVCLAFEA